jgi:hypothetical protein
VYPTFLPLRFQTAGETQSLQLAVKHDTVEADFRCAPLDKRGEAI